MIQYMFSERTHYVGRLLKTRENGDWYVDFGDFGTRWVKSDKCLVVSA